MDKHQRNGCNAVINLARKKCQNVQTRRNMEAYVVLGSAIDISEINQILFLPFMPLATVNLLKFCLYYEMDEHWNACNVVYGLVSGVGVPRFRAKCHNPCQSAVKDASLRPPIPGRA